ncbi:uncharacterized protein LOC143299421 isoform X2 [Babylonia areolata]|uniref:uncharacterized protein LOC143299421 isoform X2 n=1 Tax=Babylonia areolata TaxID=304850 RepID=UPI003FCF2680
MLRRLLRVVLFLLCAVGCSVCPAWAYNDDPCMIYGTIEESWRDPSADAPLGRCDDRNLEGWYTFLLAGDNAIIPTTCIQDNSCGANIPRHVDLEGQSMPGVGQEINASLCGSFVVLGAMDCCVYRQRIAIRHCSSPEAYIYFLPPPHVCSSATCVVRLKDNQVDREHRYEKGDTPRSLQTTTTAPQTTTEAVDECRLRPEVCRNGTCRNTPGGYACDCDQGFEPELNATECHDKDECMEVQGVCEGGQCFNTLGSYFCQCPVGYKWSTQAQRCEDINECEEVAQVCRVPDTTCNNTEGNFTCLCAPGFLPDPHGHTCHLITTTSTTEPTTSTQEPVTTATASTELVTESSGTTETLVTSSPQENCFLRFILLGQYEDTLAEGVEEAIMSGTRRTDLASTILLTNTTLPGVMEVCVRFTNATGDVISAETASDLLDLEAFEKHLPNNVTLLISCTPGDRCERPSPVILSPVQYRGSLYLILFIAATSALVLVLVVIGCVVFFRRYNRRGSWTSPPEQG